MFHLFHHVFHSFLSGVGVSQLYGFLMTGIDSFLNIGQNRYFKVYFTLLLTNFKMIRGEMAPNSYHIRVRAAWMRPRDHQMPLREMLFSTMFSLKFIFLENKSNAFSDAAILCVSFYLFYLCLSSLLKTLSCFVLLFETFISCVDKKVTMENRNIIQCDREDR